MMSQLKVPLYKSLKAGRPRVHRRHVELPYRLGDFCFTTKVLYHDVDLQALERALGEDVSSLYAHMALYESLKYCAAFPAELDITELQDWLTTEAVEQFPLIYAKAYTQNRYENNLPDYRSPVITGEGQWKGRPFTGTVGQNPERLLAGNGGGKDSLAVMKVLEAAGMEFSLFQWARSEYGRFADQHALCDRLAARSAAMEVHRLTVHDDFSDGEFLKAYHPELHGAFTLGTPECLFEALPIVLAHGYSGLCFGNERSADRGNLFWPPIGEEVNHQWVKSLEAERIFDRLLQRLVSPFRYFSLLKPIHDCRIFDIASRHVEALPDTHSCNIRKPWCKSCPKCAYVWLAFLALLEREQVEQIFGPENPFDKAELQPFYRELMGLSDHNSFECVGHIEESRIFLHTCAAKGLKGEGIDLFRQAVLPGLNGSLEKLREAYGRVYESEHNIPAGVWEYVKPHL